MSDDDVLVTVGEDLGISLYPNRYAYQADPSGYIIKNYRRPVPAKMVLDETGSPATTIPYPVDYLSQPVTYRIALPLNGVEDINQLRIIDTVDPSMNVVPDSWVKYDNGTPYYVTDSNGNPVYGFEALLTGQGQTLAFQIQNIADISQLAGKTLYFEFKAYVSTSAEAFAAINPDMATSNRATLIINDDLRNTELSNDAQTLVTLYEAEVTKYAEIQGGGRRTLRPGESATFALYQVIGGRDADPLAPTDDRYIGDFITGADSMLHLENLDVGDYVLVETRAPLGYRRAEPTYFTIADSLTAPLALEVLNPLPYPAQLLKRVAPLNLDGTPGPFIEPTAAPEQESTLELTHLHDGFVYQITGILPASMEGYLRLRFTDILPYGVVADKVELVVGGMNGDTFVPMFTGTSPNPAGNQAERMLAAFAMNPAYPQTLTFFQGDPTMLLGMQGMAYQLYVYAHIDNAITTTDGLHLVDGKITNTATFAVNSDTIYTDIASVIPPPLFGMRITKMGDRRNALGEPDQYLADAAFILSAEPGSSLPPNYGAIQASDATGQLTFLNSLEPGTYTLFEVAAPAGFMAEYPYHEVTIDVSGAMTVQPYRLEEAADGTLARVDAAAPLGYTGPDADGYFHLTIENRQMTSVPVYKTWADLQNSGDTRPDRVYLFLLRRVVRELSDGYTATFTNPEDIPAQAPVISPIAEGAPDEFDTSFYSWVKLDKYQSAASFQHVTGPLYLRNEAGELYDYFIVEAGPLDPAEAPSTFEMPVRGYTTDVNQTTHTVTNTLNTAALTINKLDETDAAALAGAEFRVSHMTDTGLSTWVYTSGADGKINLAGLLPLSRAYFSGTATEQTSNVYTIQEIRPPLGYLADTTVYTAVVDQDGAVSMYTHYEEPGSPNNVPAGPNFTATAGGGALTVPNTPMVIPPIEKLVNGSTGAVLNDLYETVTYSLSVPIRETSGFTSMLVEDSLPQGMEFVSTLDTVTVTDEAGRDIKGLGTLSLLNGTLTWAVGSDTMASLTNHTVTIRFEARVSDTETVTSLTVSGVYVPNRGIANDATVTFNADPLSSSVSGAVYIIPASDVPTISKQVNGANFYNMGSNEDTLLFEMKVPLPAEVSNYQSLSIADAFEPAFLINTANITFYAITYAPDGSEALRTTLRRTDNELGPQQYTLSNINGAWTAAFVDGFDFTTLSGQTLLLQVSATLNRDADLSGFIDPDGIIRIENTATAKVNTETITSNTVSVTPPAIPVIRKLVEGKEELVLTSGTIEGSFVYEIKTSLPFNTAGFNIIEIRDVIPPYLTLQGEPEVFTDAIGATPITVSYDTNHTLTAILDKTVIPQYSGSDITISFTATIDQTRLTSASRIDNTAEVLLNGDRTSQSTASILPTTGRATLTKSLDQGGGWPAGETAVFKLERFVSGVYVLINDSLTVSDANPLPLGELIVGTYRLTETKAPAGYIAAPPVSFEITGIIPDGQTEENVAVLVTDSKEPSIAKTADKTYLNDFSDTVTYTISAQVNSVSGMSELVIEDILDGQLQSVSASAVTEPGGTDLTDTYLSYDALTGKIRLYLPQSALGLVENQTILLSVTAALRNGFSYSLLGADAKADGIPNHAALAYNADPATLQVTDDVYVKIPVSGISLTKTGDGLPLASGLAATFNLFKVEGLPDGNGDTQPDILLGNHETQYGVIEVNDLEPGSYYFVETESPEGYRLDSLTKHAFTITVNNDATTAVSPAALTADNISYAYAFQVLKTGLLDAPLGGAVFDLVPSLGGTTASRTTQSAAGAGQGIADFGIIRGGTYVLVERVPPLGYRNSTDAYTVVAGETLQVFRNGLDITAELEDITGGKKLTVANIPDTISVPITKQWVGGQMLGARPPVTIRLLAGGNAAYHFGGVDPVLDIVLDGATDGVETAPWRAAFTNLPRVDDAGRPIAYTIQETMIGADSVVGGKAGLYEVTLDQVNYRVTNTYVSPPTQVYARKVWSGGPEADHTAPTMNLFQNGRLYPVTPPAGTPSIVVEGAFDYIWQGLPLTDSYGQTYDYYADEASVPPGYGKTISGKGLEDDPYVITNTYGAELTDIAVQKDWIGGPAIRPEITLQLQRRLSSQTVFQDVGLPVTLESGLHIHVWRQEPMFSQLGEAYVYRVVETHIGTEPVSGGIAGNYAVTPGGSWSEGLTVTNTYLPPKTQVSVSKQYINGAPITHVPVQVQLFREAESGQKEYVGAAVELNEGNAWAHQWNLLDKTNMVGEEYRYTVAELNQQPGYTVNIQNTGTLEQPEYLIINTYGAPTGDITAYKRWSGGDTLTRPGGIYFQLYADAALVENSRLPLDGTEVTWPNRPLFTTDGNPIAYTVREVDMNGADWRHDDYTTQISGLTVTNTYRSPTINVHARKVWSGGPVDDHTAPEINLYQNGRLYARIPEVTPGSGTADAFDYVWSNLPETDAFGQAYYYTVTEAGVPADYVSSAISGLGTPESPYSVTNTFVDAGNTTFTAFKQWTGGEAAGPRPEITLQLLRAIENGVPQAVPPAAGTIENPVTLQSGTVVYSWENLPAFDEQRRAYTYSVQETQIGQTAVSDGRAGNYLVVNHGRYVTNTYDPPPTTVYARVIWDGGDPAGHTAPDLVILRNGAPLSAAEMAGVRIIVAPELGTSDVFDYAFIGLPATDARGANYTYSVVQPEVPDGYNASDEGGSGTQPDPMVILNSYLSPAELTIPAESQLIGGTLQAGQFTFQLLDNEWNEVATVQNNADGTITFPREIVKKGGRSVYLMRQITGDSAGMEYDTAMYAVIVDSALNSQNQYSLTVSYKKDGIAYSGTPLFVNRLTATPPGPTPTPPSYEAVSVILSAKKELHGGRMADGQFKFVLKDASGTIVSEVGNQEDGSIRFDPRRFSREGVFLYHLSEVQDGQTGVNYDTNTYVARVRVTDYGGGALSASVRYMKNGEDYPGTPVFVNRYGTPETGDRALELPILLLLLALTLAAAGLILGKAAGKAHAAKGKR